ncbi:MAG: hypothetical protein SGJ27_05665 [Candidatus Melainabacteria bacterium]|nr:hypothetical protein [Candidatus Melainabacteria bacterium]
MNRAIFQYSLFSKFTSYIDWVVLLAIIVSPTLMMCLVVYNIENHEYKVTVAKTLFSNFSNSWLWMLIAYVFVSDALVARRPVGDAAPLCLLFTRPIPRINYVISKWLAGAIGIFAVMVPSAYLFQIACLPFDITTNFMDSYMFAELAANAVSYSALMVFLHCLPPGIGALTYATMIGITNTGNTLASFNDKGDNWFTHAMHDLFVFLSFWLGDFTYPTIDVYTMLTSVTFDWHPVVVYVSNIILYLVLGTLCMVHREFFYATD